MCEGRDTSGARDSRDDLRHAGAAARDERRLVVAEQAVERISAIDGVSGRDKRVGDERSADAPAAGGRRRREEGIDIDAAIQRLQPLGHLTHALHARRPLRLEEAMNAPSRRSKK